MLVPILLLLLRLLLFFRVFLLFWFPPLPTSVTLSARQKRLAQVPPIEVGSLRRLWQARLYCQASARLPSSPYKTVSVFHFTLRRQEDASFLFTVVPIRYWYRVRHTQRGQNADNLHLTLSTYSPVRGSASLLCCCHGNNTLNYHKAHIVWVEIS